LINSPYLYNKINLICLKEKYPINYPVNSKTGCLLSVNCCNLISSVKICSKTRSAPMKKIMILMTALLGLFCQGEDGKCEDIGACNNCMKIYDFQGNYINGGPMSGSSPVYWDGRDCNGDTVPCGKYRVVYVMGGRQMKVKLLFPGRELSRKTAVRNAMH